MISSDRIRAKIEKDYNKNPDGWQAYVSNNKGHIDSIFINEDNLYIIKEQIINPFKSIGLGVKRRISFDLKESNQIKFGLRPVNPKLIDNLINNNQSGSNNFINKILKQKPSSYKNIKTPIILQGPVNYSSLNMKEIWKNEKDLDSRLRIELQKILDKKYSYITSIYS